MRLTPLDIKKQEFKKSVRGFDRIEVESFLEMIAEEFECLIREKNTLADEVLKLKTQLQDYQNVERTLQDTLVSAQESIKASRESSEREADSIIREAELKAEKILEDSKLKLANLKNELLVIKSQKDSIARRLKHLLGSQLELIEVLEMDDLGFDDYGEKQGADTAQDEREQVVFEGVDEVLPNATSQADRQEERPPTEGEPEHDRQNPHGAPQQRRAHDAGQPAPHDDQSQKREQSQDPRDSNEAGRSRITDHLILD